MGALLPMATAVPASCLVVQSLLALPIVLVLVATVRREGKRLPASDYESNKIVSLKQDQKTYSGIAIFKGSALTFSLISSYPVR